MLINLRKIVRPAIVIVLLAAVAITIVRMALGHKQNPFILGGSLHANVKLEQDLIQPVFKRQEGSMDEERFQRPSKQPAMKLKYNFKDFEDIGKVPRFGTAENAIHAYYAILKEAENMNGYHGGCGTIGLAKMPYPYAYELLAPETKQQISLEEFIKSFSGIGHITLLELYPAYQPAGTPENIRYYMVEIEIITGPPYTDKNKNIPQPGYFAYYYGLVTVEKTPSEGWKIKSVDYIPEDFLCAPYHHWDWDAKDLVEIIYESWYGLIDKIERTEKENSIIRIYAKGDTNEYRFDFVRLTNGEDILLHEYIMEKGKWKEVNLLKEEHQIYKFSILNPILNKY